MEILDKIVCAILWTLCYLGHEFVIYTNDMFTPGTKAYKGWIKSFKVMIGIIIVMLVWSVVYHLNS